MPIPALAIEGLQKSFGDKKALDGIDLHLSSGKVLALLAGFLIVLQQPSQTKLGSARSEWSWPKLAII